MLSDLIGLMGQRVSLCRPQLALIMQPEFHRWLTNFIEFSPKIPSSSKALNKATLFGMVLILWFRLWVCEAPRQEYNPIVGSGG